METTVQGPAVIDRGSPSGEAVENRLAPLRGAGSATAPQGLKRLAAFTAILCLCFAKPLYRLAWHALHSELFSYIPLIPCISLYLVWIMRRDLAPESEPARRWAALPFLAGFGLLAAYWWAVNTGWNPIGDDYLALMTLCFLALFLAGAFLFLGTATMRKIAFPLAFLVFMVPFPHVVEQWIESFFQQGSADAAYLMFKLSGMPVFRQGTEFQLPGFSLAVAPQCSGIHSSLVLFITSLLAGYLLLRTPWAKGALALAVIPLGLLRNGFRVCVIGNLCVRLSPEWINSDLHHRGGPIFFAASLVPFFLLLLILRKLERRRSKSNPKLCVSQHESSTQY